RCGGRVVVAAVHRGRADPLCGHRAALGRVLVVRGVLYRGGAGSAGLGGGHPRSPCAPAAVGGVVGNALVVLTWIVTRTVGSLVGPAATAPARAGFGDLVATALQVLIDAGGCGLLTRRLGARTGAWTGHAPVIAALIVVPFLVLALY